MKQCIGTILGIFGIFLLMATASGSDMNVIGIKQIVIQSAIALGMIGIGGKLAGVFYEDFM